MSKRKETVKAIIVAAGQGRRFSGTKPKQFLRLGAQTILEHSLTPFQRLPEIDEIVVVLPPTYVTAYARKLKKKFHKISAVVPGGASRTRSVILGLKAASGASVYLIHDGARPFVGRPLIKKVTKAAIRFGASIAAMQATDTVKESKRSRFVSKTLPRERIYLVQTPQGFKQQVLMRGVKAFLSKRCTVTDDSALVERCGFNVKIVESDRLNFKITTRRDLEMARRLQDFLDSES